MALGVSGVLPGPRPVVPAPKLVAAPPPATICLTRKPLAATPSTTAVVTLSVEPSPKPKLPGPTLVSVRPSLKRAAEGSVVGPPPHTTVPSTAGPTVAVPSRPALATPPVAKRARVIPRQAPPSVKGTFLGLKTVSLDSPNGQALMQRTSMFTEAAVEKRQDARESALKSLENQEKLEIAASEVHSLKVTVRCCKEVNLTVFCGLGDRLWKSRAYLFTRSVGQ